MRTCLCDLEFGKTFRSQESACPRVCCTTHLVSEATSLSRRAIGTVRSNSALAIAGDVALVLLWLGSGVFQGAGNGDNSRVVQITAEDFQRKGVPFDRCDILVFGGTSLRTETIRPELLQLILSTQPGIVVCPPDAAVILPSLDQWGVKVMSVSVDSMAAWAPTFGRTLLTHDDEDQLQSHNLTEVRQLSWLAPQDILCAV